MWKDSETEIDYLDYRYMVDMLKDIICDDELLPASIGIYGDWGSGKSSLIHMCKSRLETECNATCLIFNGWLFENYSDAKAALLNSILDEIEQEGRLTEEAKRILKALYKSVDKFSLVKNASKIGADLFITGGIGTLTALSLNSIMSSIKGTMSAIDNEMDNTEVANKYEQAIKDELTYKKLREDIREFQKTFSNLIDASKISRLVIFIDELDRCREDTILDTLEAMKLFMFTGRVAFVIGADERHISYAVKSKFKDIEGIQIDIGKEYLEKLIQYPIRIPRLDIDETEIYIALLLLSKEVEQNTFEKVCTAIYEAYKKDFFTRTLKHINLEHIDSVAKNDLEKSNITECISFAYQLAEILSEGLHGNPRQIKRFLNTLDMRMKMAKYKHTTLDRKILAKLMMLEYIRPTEFNVIARMAANNELEKELQMLESNKKESSDEKTNLNIKLDVWKKDAWLLNWLQIEPKLSNHVQELNPYFYFARTSLDEKISRISLNLSPKAQSVLEKLISHSDFHLKKALEEDISDTEANIILQAMASKMSGQSKIESQDMKALIQFGMVSEGRYVTTLRCLSGFSAKSLPAASGVYLAKFAKKTNFHLEVSELINKWGEVNCNLKTTFMSAKEN